MDYIDGGGLGYGYKIHTGERNQLEQCLAGVDDPTIEEARDTDLR